MKTLRTMTREELIEETIDLITEDVKTQAFDGEILPDLLTLITTERLRKFLPKDDNEDEVESCAVAECFLKSKSASLKHWEQCFLSGTVDDEHAEFIAGVLAKAREDIS